MLNSESGGGAAASDTSDSAGTENAVCDIPSLKPRPSTPSSPTLQVVPQQTDGCRSTKPAKRSLRMLEIDRPSERAASMHGSSDLPALLPVRNAMSVSSAPPSS